MAAAAVAAHEVVVAAADKKEKTMLNHSSVVRSRNFVPWTLLGAGLVQSCESFCVARLGNPSESSNVSQGWKGGRFRGGASERGSEFSPCSIEWEFFGRENHCHAVI